MSIRPLRVDAPLALWGGVECTVNRVGDDYHDQLAITGHERRDGDIERVARLGLRTLRYPIVWERIAPRGLADADWRLTDRALAAARAAGVRIIAGLVHHGSGPRYATLATDDFAEQLAAFARAVAERYPWLDAYTPVNEPLTTARFCGLYGLWFPHQRSDASFVRILLRECRGAVLAMRAVREINPLAQFIQTDDAGTTFSTERLAYQAAYENERRWLGWDLVSGRVDARHPLYRYLRSFGATDQELGWFVDHACAPDLIGLNYYVTSDRFLDEAADRYPAHFAGGNGRDAYADVEAVRARGSIGGHRAILEAAWQRYQLPVAITEAHLGCTREEQMRWLTAAWNGANDARRAGVDVRAVTAWALFGLSDWDTLVTSLQGHYECGAYDVRSADPRPTALARVIIDLAAGRTPAHDVLQNGGWWERHQPRRASLHTRRRPIIVAGATGTLGSAFGRLCAARGLACDVLTRQQLDIADSDSIAAAIERLQPWAVINAAGYVRVDEAEREPDRCARENTYGPTLLAEACADARLPLVTFSSDLVFDGGADRPYVEEDVPQPLNVYGLTKADAERNVSDVHPGALIVRTSAFFGPWDRWNFIHLALEAIAAGRAWRAADDQCVSPTYVPDLVNTTLDLLIDGATGIWHLANAGAVTWAELARRAAAIAGLRPELVEPCHTRALGIQATMPRYSVLGTERGQILPPLEDALARYLVERPASMAALCATERIA